MGYKVYGEDETPRVRRKEFMEWLIVSFLWFPTSIGSWLVYFGMPIMWTSMLTILVAVAVAWYFSKSENRKG